MRIQPEQCKRRTCKRRALIVFSLSIFLNSNMAMLFARIPQVSPQKEIPELHISASFAGKDRVAPTDLIQLRLSRRLEAAEGTLAVFIGQMDITNLFTSNEKGLSYSPQALHLPAGENPLIVYLVSPSSEWKEIAKFPLRVKPGSGAGQVEERATTSTKEIKKHGFDKFEIEPSLTLSLKAESTVLFFPESSRPDRINFTDFTLQGSVQTNLARGSLTHQNQFDFVGTTSQKEALRFGESNKAAPQIDLSSYLTQFEVKKIKVVLGHHSYGTNRYLINGFSSRGLDVTVPIGSRFDFKFNATNGTSIVGWSNFSGLGKRNHKIIAATVGSEFFPEHPGWLRLEVGLLRGSLLPINNFNQRNLTDAETSHGFGGRIVATDSQGRLRLDAGYARSRFGNPADPLLGQGFSVVPVRDTTRNARYLDVTYQILKDQAITRDRRANLSLTFRHNRVDPLFRSVAVFTQADRADNQFELTGSFGEITAGLVHNRLNDNLNDVPSVLKTLTRRDGLSLGVPLTSVLGNTHPFSPWLPRLSYNFDRTHAFGAFLPVNSGFALSHVPDQASTNHNLNMEWAHNDLRFGYRFNQSLQDNRQVGRANADFRTLVNALTFGIKPYRRLELSFDLSSERAANLEVNRLDHGLRLAFGSNFQTTKKSILATNVSSNLAGDAANTNRNRSIDLDLQWSWRFGIEKSSHRKLQGQLFVRYANRYARAQDNIFFFNTLTKFQSLSGGLSITLF